MRAMSSVEIRKLNREALLQKERELRSKLLELRLQSVTQHSKSSEGEQRAIKKSLARILTIQCNG